MTKDEVMAYLEAHRNAAVKRIYTSHGAIEPLFGVKLGDLKTLKKKIKTDHRLALELYQTGNSDAMYLAGLIEDPEQVTARQMEEWIKTANWDMLSDRCVAAVAAKTPFAFELARRWVASSNESTVCAGYGIYCILFSVLDDREIDFDEVRRLLDEMTGKIHDQTLRVQNGMKNFLINAGIYIKPLHDVALVAAEKIGAIEPAIVKNSCNIQTAVDYIKKYEEKGKIGIKIKKFRA